MRCEVFLGIDQSLNGTGLCTLSSTGAWVASSTVTPKHLRDGERLAYIKAAVTACLPQVTHAALEGYAYNAAGRVFELGEVGGVLKVLLVEHGIPYVVVPPVLVKKFATGITAADKPKMLAAAREHGHDFGDEDDQADAFFLAHIARALIQNTAERRCEREVLKTLRNAAIPTAPSKRRHPRKLIPNAL